MDWPYAYTWQIWPALAAAAFFVALIAYSWRHRSVPGALSYTALNTFAVPWVLGAASVMAATDASTKIFWLKFVAVWQLPAVTAGLCFALEYANLGRWLTRRRLLLLAVPPALVFLLILTNGLHHWFWVGTWPGEPFRLRRGIAGDIFWGYGLLLASLAPMVFVWLFVRSPLHRWPAALCLLGQLAPRVVYLLATSHAKRPLGIESVAFGFMIGAAAYALALFRFRLFDLIPIARGTIIEQMREGMLVLDPQHRIIEMNPAAERILGTAAGSAQGTDARQLLPIRAVLDAQDEASPASESEIHLDTDGAGRDYRLRFSALKNAHGYRLGRLVFFHDITEPKRAQAQLLEQQCAVATLQERVRIGHELHDGVAQVLAYMKMQAEVAQSFLAQDRPAEANRRLSRLVIAAQDAHADVREYILGAGISRRDGFLPALERYLRQFGENYSLTTKLNVSPEIVAGSFGPTVEAQLLRMIQEALTNVRKHAQARAVDVRLHVRDNLAEALIQDDGSGFDPASLETAGQKFGLRFMRERAEEVGGSLEVRSEPGRGTQVMVRVPIQRIQ